MALAAYIASRAANKTYLEVGTQGGDVLACVRKYARRVLSVEMNPKRCAQLRAQGLDVVCAEMGEAIDNATLRDELTQAEIIFMWLESSI